MDGKRSYLDTLNDGRLRRTTNSLDELNRSLQELEFRLQRHTERPGAALPAARGAAGADPESEAATATRRDAFDVLRRDLQAALVQPPAGVAARSAPEPRPPRDHEPRHLGGQDRQAGPGQAGIQEIRDALGTLAREETVREGNARWADFDRRFHDLERRVEAAANMPGSSQQDFAQLHTRVDDIGAQLAALPNSLSLRALEDKMRMLATAIDTFSRQEDPYSATAKAQIEERLDEISRAIAASSALQPSLDPQPFERIEARITSLARQIGELLESAQQTGLADLIAKLAGRIDELAARAALPEEAIEHLVQQVSGIAARLDQPAAAPIAASALQGIEERFDLLAHIFDQRHDDAIAHGRALFEDVERRLDQIAERLETPQGGLEDGAIDALAERIELMTARLGSVSPAAELDAIGPRLRELERSVRDHRDGVAEAVRQAADEAVRALAERQPAASGEGLTAELKAIEGLTRRSEERNAKTFEAIHDTLLKIVERLASMERAAATDDGQPRRAVSQAPSIAAIETGERSDLANHAPPSARTPAEAAAAAAVAALRDGDEEMQTRLRSVLGLGRRPATQGDEGDLGGPGEAPVGSAGPSPEIEPPLDPKFANLPLPPGSGAPDLNAILKRVRDERLGPLRPSDADAAKSDFFAAAKRAAQAAAAEADIAKRAAQAEGQGTRLRFGGLFRTRRKALFLSGAGIVLALAGMQLGKAVLAADPATELMPNPPSSAMSTLAQPPVPVMALPAPAAATAPSAAPMDPAPSAEPDRTTAAGELAPNTTASLDPEMSAAPDMPAPAVPTAPTPDTAVAVPDDAGPPALRQAAATGDAKAMFELGARFADGRGVKADAKAAAGWYRQAAEKGLAPAQYRIGNLSEKGIGIDRDIAAAKRWYRLAAEQGNASAMHNLAVLLATATDGPPDNAEAVRWFTKAAELGVTDSQFNLGILAAKGVGMKQDLGQSYLWFGLVAKTGDHDAAAKRDEIGKTLSAEQLKTAEAAVESWQAKPIDAAANSVEIPASWRDTDTGATNSGVDMKKVVHNIQLILNKNGYDAGSADGVMGSKTKAAIAAFRGDNGLPANASVDEPLVRKLLARK